MDAEDAVMAGRLHFEAGTVQAEPGVDEAGLADLERRGVPVVRWKRKNLFFGGAQAVRRDADGRLSGGGDPRRGGAVAFA
jgi:gamma-glutamyltranspeptidase / glutathione hydrolase